MIYDKVLVVENLGVIQPVTAVEIIEGLGELTVDNSDYILNSKFENDIIGEPCLN